jgi:hypothetical protein
VTPAGRLRLELTREARGATPVGRLRLEREREA